MLIYQNCDVLEAALDRIRFFFDEFPNVIVANSGGKDSTVILNLAKQVARERGRLPLTTIFIDQEAEWQHTVDYFREIRKDPEITLLWYQVPIRIFNGSSHEKNWLNCWGEGEQWMREKEPDSIHENTFGTDRFGPLFNAIVRSLFPAEPVAMLGGIRCEESPTRMVAMTHQSTYKHVTYGKKLDRQLGHYTFYPIYDWHYTDVWKAIHENGWPYNRGYMIKCTNTATRL